MTLTDHIHEKTPSAAVRIFSANTFLLEYRLARYLVESFVISRLQCVDTPGLLRIESD